MELTCDEIVDILYIKYFAESTIGYTLPQGTYKISEFNLVLKSLLAKEVKVNLTIDDNTLRSNLTSNKFNNVYENYFFYTKLDFTRSYLDSLNDPPERYNQKIAGTLKSEKPNNNTGIDKISFEILKYDCINGSIVNAVCEPILYSFALDKLPGYKIYKELGI